MPSAGQRQEMPFRPLSNENKAHCHSGPTFSMRRRTRTGQTPFITAHSHSGPTLSMRRRTRTGQTTTMASDAFRRPQARNATQTFLSASKSHSRSRIRTGQICGKRTSQQCYVRDTLVTPLRAISGKRTSPKFCVRYTLVTPLVVICGKRTSQ